jgi:tRNA(Arg) A34 adenosine deaminase TadA
MNESEALTKGELPIAAVLADGNAILYEGHNEIASTADLDAHAEAGVVRGAKPLLRGMKRIDRSRLTLYSTLEPCFMCCGIAMTYNIGTMCYALESPGDGVLPILHAWKKKSEQLPHYCAPEMIGGVLRAESAVLFGAFALRYPDSRFAKWTRQLYSLIPKTPLTLLF